MTKNVKQFKAVTKRHETLSLCQVYKIVNSLDCNFTNYFTLPIRPSRHFM